jgi:hypothetical protein
MKIERYSCPYAYLLKHCAMKVYGCVVRFTPRQIYAREKVPGTHCIRDWVGLQASLDDVEKRKFLTLPGLKLQPLSL